MKSDLGVPGSPKTSLTLSKTQLFKYLQNGILLIRCQIINFVLTDENEVCLEKFTQGEASSYLPTSPSHLLKEEAVQLLKLKASLDPGFFSSSVFCCCVMFRAFLSVGFFVSASSI